MESSEGNNWKGRTDAKLVELEERLGRLAERLDVVSGDLRDVIVDLARVDTQQRTFVRAWGPFLVVAGGAAASFAFWLLQRALGA